MSSGAESQPEEDHAQEGASTELQQQGNDVPRLLQLLKDFDSGEKKRGVEFPENDFSDADLSHGEFKNQMNLTGIKFSDKDDWGKGEGLAVNLENANLNGANLENANLNGANLENAKLRRANLKNAKLGRAHLENAILHGAHLEVAQLYQAHLENAHLQHAYLQYANLKQAYLENANLKAAHLENARLDSAKLKGAKFERAFINTDTDFSDAEFSPFRPPQSRASRTSGTWRMKAVAKKCGLEIFNHCLVGGDAEGSDEEDDEDDDEAGAADAEETNDDILQEVEEDKIVNQCVTETMDVLEPVIDAVTLLLQIANLTLKKSLEILKTVTEKLEIFSDKKAVETYINRKVTIIMVLLVEKFISVTIERFCEDDFNISMSRILKDNLEDFKKELIKELQTTDVTIDNWIDQHNLDLLENSEIGEYPNESKSAARFFFVEIGEALRAEALYTLWAETDRVLKDMFILYNDDLEAGCKEINSVSEVLTVLLEPMHEKLSKLLSSGIKGNLSKFLTNHCNSKIQKLAEITKNHIKMAGKFEEILLKKCNSLGNKMNRYFPKGKIKSNMIKSMLSAATKYRVEVGGDETTINTMIRAVRLSWGGLKTTEAELAYLLDKLVKIEEMDVTVEKWRDAAQTWMSLINLMHQLKAERSIAVINCIASDERVLEALSAAKALLYSVGGSNTIVSILSNEPGRHIRENGYRYQRTIRQEIVQIQKICRFQVLLISFIGTTIASALIALFNYLFRFAGDTFTSWWQPPVIMICGIMFLFMILCIFVWCCRCQGNNDRRRSGGRGRKKDN